MSKMKIYMSIMFKIIEKLVAFSLILEVKKKSLILTAYALLFSILPPLEVTAE